MLRKYLTEDEQTLLLNTVKPYADVLARRDHAWLRALIHTGFRITEFSLLTVADAQAALHVGYIHIPAAHRKGRAGKKRAHTKLVTQPVREALLDLLDIRREMGDLTGGDVPLVLSRNHQAMSVRSYQARTAYWAERAGITGKVSPHWFRHTRAMNIMRRSTSNDPRGIVQSDLGHANIASTGIYTGMTRETLQDALEEVDGRKTYRKRDIARLAERRAA